MLFTLRVKYFYTGVSRSRANRRVRRGVLAKAKSVRLRPLWVRLCKTLRIDQQEPRRTHNRRTRNAGDTYRRATSPSVCLLRTGMAGAVKAHRPHPQEQGSQLLPGRQYFNNVGDDGVLGYAQNHRPHFYELLPSLFISNQRISVVGTPTPQLRKLP